MREKFPEPTECETILKGNPLKYCRFDHTADIGVRIFGESKERLFEHAAEALFSFIIERDTYHSEAPASLTRIITGETLEDLFINWMRELLLLFNLKERLLVKATVSKMTEQSLSADLVLVPYDPVRHDILTDIKAVTYHGLIVEKRDDEWFAQVIFDV